MALCQAYPASGGFVRGMLDFVDCQALTLGANGYQAMAAPGSPASQVLTGLLTLFVALFGYRMLLGHTPGIRDGLLALVKVGIVLTLATNWPAYRTLVYDVMLRGPAQLAATIGSSADIPAANGGLVARLDNADTMLATLAGLGAGYAAQSAAPPLGSTPASYSMAANNAVFTGFDGWAVGMARLTFLTGTIGAFAGVRLVTALLLTLGPLFIAFLLFEGTYGLFLGWLRVLAGAALGATLISVVLGIELALIEPWLIDLIGRRYAHEGIGGVPTQLLAAALVFDLLLLAVIIGAARVMAGFNLIFPAVHRIFASATGFAQSPSKTRPVPILERVTQGNRSRAMAVADTVAAAQRRESNAILSGGTSNMIGGTPATQGPPTVIMGITPLGQSARRRTATRVSAGASRRDRAL